MRKLFPVTFTEIDLELIFKGLKIAAHQSSGLEQTMFQMEALKIENMCLPEIVDSKVDLKVERRRLEDLPELTFLFD